MYDYNVKWCPICNQGWVQIVKEIETEVLFLLCEECESEWNNPQEIEKENCTRDTYGFITTPTYSEIMEKGWQKFIIK